MKRQVNGPAIRAIRMGLGIKQQDLAERAGISPSHMNKIESGAENGRFETVVRIAEQLGVPVDTIAPVVRPVAEATR